jgi:hypothetical protein
MSSPVRSPRCAGHLKMRRAAWAILISSALVVHGRVDGASAGPVVSPVRGVDIRIPARGSLLGAYVQVTGSWNRTTEKAAVRRLESRMHRRLAIDSHYEHWGWKFPGWVGAWDLRNGRIPMFSGFAFSTQAINSGVEDAYIRARARAVKVLGGPVLIRWFHEMDARPLAELTGKPDRFIRSWQRVVRIFRSQGARNAQWVWCPNASGFVTGRSQRFYPGDRYVDWVCADGYNWSPLLPDGETIGRWRPFREIFDKFYRWAAKRGKPIMVAEIGAQEAGPKRKARWITNIAHTMKDRFHRIKGLVYFDARAGSNAGGTFDWRLRTSRSSMAAWSRLAHRPWFEHRG